MIRFKDPLLEVELRDSHINLQMLVKAFAEKMKEKYGSDITITDINRLGDPDSVHCARPTRGADIRVDGDFIDGKVVDRPFTDEPTVEEARNVAAEMNRQYIYDPKRPEKSVAIFGELDKSNKHWNHVHLQATDETIMPMIMIPPKKANITLVGSGMTKEEAARVESFCYPRASKADIAWMIARRVSKFATGALIGYGVVRLGGSVGEGVIAAGSYMGLEKGANVIAQSKTGQSQNYDLLTLITTIAKMIVDFLAKRKK